MNIFDVFDFEPEDKVLLCGQPGVVVKFWENSGIVVKSDCARYWYHIDGEELFEMVKFGDIERIKK